jgi:hypothetical protein
MSIQSAICYVKRYSVSEGAANSWNTVNHPDPDPDPHPLARGAFENPDRN